MRTALKPMWMLAMMPAGGQKEPTCSKRRLSCASPVCSGQLPAAACSSRISTWAAGKLGGGGKGEGRGFYPSGDSLGGIGT